MNLIAGLPEPVVLVAGLALIVACGCAGIAAILGVQPLAMSSRRRTLPLLEHEKDVAAALGWQWRRWLALRAGVTLAGIAVGVTTQIWLLTCAPRRWSASSVCDSWSRAVLRGGGSVWNALFSFSFVSCETGWQSAINHSTPRSRRSAATQAANWHTCSPLGRGWIGHREHRLERTAFSIGACRARLCRSDLGENPKSRRAHLRDRRRPASDWRSTVGGRGGVPRHVDPTAGRHLRHVGAHDGHVRQPRARREFSRLLRNGARNCRPPRRGGDVLCPDRAARPDCTDGSLDSLGPSSSPGAGTSSPWLRQSPTPPWRSS